MTLQPIRRRLDPERHRSYAPPVSSLRRRPAPWALSLVSVLVGVFGLFAVVWVARDPRRRRRTLHRVGRSWRRVEDVATASSNRVRRKTRKLEEEARRLARELWDAVDDLPFVPNRHKFLISLPVEAPAPEAPVRATRITNQYYAHGSFMGAAPSLLEDSRWRRILAFLMPDVYLDVQRAVALSSQPHALIPMFENNPVMAAFGVWRSVEVRRITGEALKWAPLDLAGMEWDVFLSGDRVEAWENATGPERDAELGRLVDTMVIAHASTTDTVQEQIGLCQWDDVRRTRKAALGGVEPSAWLDLYARALILAESAELRAAIREMVDEPRVQSYEQCLDHTFVNPLSSERAVAVHRRITGREQFSVVLEVKSQRCTLPLLVAVVEELNRRRIHVAAVGSFLIEEIRNISRVTQVVDGVTLPGPREIVFLHFAGDLQLACDRRQLRPGTSAMFNGASLLTGKRTAAGYVYAVDEVVVAELEEYRRKYALSLGLYVQENDCDVAAATLLTELVVRMPETFELGFAWGGVLDEGAIRAGLGDHRGFGSQRVLERLRVASPWKRRPPG